MNVDNTNSTILRSHSEQDLSRRSKSTPPVAHRIHHTSTVVPVSLDSPSSLTVPLIQKNLDGLNNGNTDNSNKIGNNINSNNSSGNNSSGNNSSSSSSSNNGSNDAWFLRTVFWMSAWYTCSLGTLFMNKVILTRLNGHVHILGIVQMTMTAVLGALKVYMPMIVAKLISVSELSAFKKKQTVEVMASLKPVLATYDPSPLRSFKKKSEKYKTFWRDMLFVGAMRGATVLLGLLSLSHVAVSFTETIKASAPLFTVIFARLILGEITTTPVIMSLFPVMFGLVLCSATELSFDIIGFLAAVSNNCIDCIQNVFSKRLLSEALSPVELQFYTSIAAVCMQLPVMVVLAGHEIIGASSLESKTVGLLFLDGELKL
jgi:solute carrier family 35 protein E2